MLYINFLYLILFINPYFYLQICDKLYKLSIKKTPNLLFFNINLFYNEIYNNKLI